MPGIGKLLNEAGGGVTEDMPKRLAKKAENYIAFVEKLRAKKFANLRTDSRLSLVASGKPSDRWMGLRHSWLERGDFDSVKLAWNCQGGVVHNGEGDLAVAGCAQGYFDHSTPGGGASLAGDGDPALGLAKVGGGLNLDESVGGNGFIDGKGDGGALAGKAKTERLRKANAGQGDGDLGKGGREGIGDGEGDRRLEHGDQLIGCGIEGAVAIGVVVEAGARDAWNRGRAEEILSGSTREAKSVGLSWGKVLDDGVAAKSRIGRDAIVVEAADAIAEDEDVIIGATIQAIHLARSAADAVQRIGSGEALEEVGA